MPEKFIIFSLPRSRSFWLSHFLSYQKDGKQLAKCGQDEFSRQASVSGCLEHA